MATVFTFVVNSIGETIEHSVSIVGFEGVTRDANRRRGSVRFGAVAGASRSRIEDSREHGTQGVPNDPEALDLLRL